MQIRIRPSIILFISMLFQSLFGQTRPAIGLHENPVNIVAFTHAKLITEPGTVIENGTLVCRDGIIESIGIDIKIPQDATLIDMTGKTIYPGFIDAYTNYGIPNNKGKNPKNDDRSKRTEKMPYWNPAVLSDRDVLDLLEPNKKETERLREWGFTSVLTSPNNGIFRGKGAVLLLDEKPFHKSILKPNTLQVISFKKGEGFSNEGTDRYPGSLQGSIALIRQTFYDAEWYHNAWTSYKKNPTNRIKPELNTALTVLNPSKKNQLFYMIASDELDIFRIAKIRDEFNLNVISIGSGHSYRRLDAVKNIMSRLIVPLHFPGAPDVSTLEKENQVNLRTLKHWDTAPENPGRLVKAGIDIAFTTSSLEKREDFLTNLRTTVNRGLSKEDALKALTTTPAKWLGLSHSMGSLTPGKLANIVIADGDIFDTKTQIMETWIAGSRFKIQECPDHDLRGTWNISMHSDGMQKEGHFEISGKPDKLKVVLTLDQMKIKSIQSRMDHDLFTLTFKSDSIGYPGVARLSGMVQPETIAGTGILSNGKSLHWQASLKETWKEKTDTSEVKAAAMASYSIVYPDGAYGYTDPPEQQDWILVKNGTIWTSGPDGIIENTDLLIHQGKIKQIAKGLKAPKGAYVIDARDKHITPGIIDPHSHIAISGGVNEASHAIVPEVRIEDVIDCDDINIYRQLASGVTSVCNLHGSANPIAGSYSVIKLKWGGLQDELLVKDAKEGFKFALGENVKQSNWPVKKLRYPRSRMGVMEIIEDAFQAAKEYRAEWERYNKTKKGMLPRKNLRHEALLKILDQKAIVHCHGYRQDEMIALMNLADEMGFKVDVFIHVLEGYKIAKELKKHDAMATTFSDWWTYKMEAFDAIPYNGTMLWEQGIVTSFNSDSQELARRLNTEAAKAIKYGNMPKEEAFKLVTLNAAKQLYMDHRIGSLEPGKDADFVIWNGSPISTYSKCEQTWIEGRQYFSLEKDAELRKQSEKQRNTLIQKILKRQNQTSKKKSS